MIKYFSILLSNLSNMKNNSDNIDSNPKKVKVAKYDNLKGLAIIFVVMAHFLAPIRGFPVYMGLTNLAAILAMGIFFFVSGYFSKVSVDTPIKAFKSLLLPYIIFSALWILFNGYVLNNGFVKLPFLTSTYGLWFLLCLFTMKLMLPILSKIKYSLPLFTIIALLIGILPLPENFLALSRTFCFTPLFLFGFNYNSYKNKFNEKILPKFKFIKKLKNKIFLLIVLLIFVGVFLSIASYLPFNAFQLESSYADMNMGKLYGMIMRFLILLSGIIFIVLLNNLMTDKPTFLTKLGLNSLAIYILHFYFARSISKIINNSQLNVIFDDPIISGIYIIIIVTIITYILSRDFITNIVNKLINICGKIIMNP